MGKQKRGKRDPRGARTRKGEQVYVFAKDLETCHGEVDGRAWDGAIVAANGNVPAAAELVGLEGVGKGAKALWGRTQEEALGIYRNWLKSQAEKRAAKEAEG